MVNTLVARIFLFLVATGLLLPTCARAQVQAKPTNLSPVVQGLSQSRSDNIFDPSPTIENPDLRTRSDTTSTTQPTLEEPEQQATSTESQNTSTHTVDTPETLEEDSESTSTISRDGVLREAQSDPALRNALEHSRRLQEQLGVVAPKHNRGKDPNDTIKNLDKTLKKQERLNEQQKYRF